MRILMNDKLKELRKRKGITQEECAKALDVNLSSYQKYEREKNNNTPSLEILVRIADYYNVTTDWLLGRSSVQPATIKDMISVTDEFSDFEKIFLLLYLDANDNTKKELCDIVRSAATEAVKKEQNGTYPLIRYLFTAPDAASAGSGYTFFDSPDWDKCRFDVSGYDADILDDCFVARVDGNSMQPMFFDGDFVLVRPDVPIEIGDIGLFMVNNDKGYIKKKGTDRLISVNPDYDDIYPSEDDIIEEKGKVLGTVEKV